MSYYSELNGLSLDELVDRFSRQPLDGHRYARVYYSEVAILCCKHGTRAAARLLGKVRSACPMQLAGIIDALTWPRLPAYRREIETLLLRSLDHRSPTVRAAAIDGLRLRKDAAGLRRVAELVTAKNPYVVGAAFRYLVLMTPRAAYPELLKAAGHKHYIVRLNVADELGELGGKDAIRILTRLTRDPHPYVRDAAGEAIVALRRGRLRNG